ncbi:hypothetical protein K5X85_36330 [Streptomyces sp. A144]|uniref:hypothetical protein n=2 Tax=Streptomyces TaxID=1883 RepID=UPI00295855C6|nr:hypothetical protein [Streptomyces sp. A144]
MDRMYEDVLAGRTIGLKARAEARRNQVRASRRATDAVDQLFRRAGGGCLRLNQPLQRDVHAAMNQLRNVANSICEGWFRDQFGLSAGYAPWSGTPLNTPAATYRTGGGRSPARPRSQSWRGTGGPLTRFSTGQRCDTSSFTDAPITRRCETPV